MVVACAMVHSTAFLIYSQKLLQIGQSQHTSILTGHLYLTELIDGYNGTFYDMLGLSKYVFWNNATKVIVYSGL